MVTNAKPHVRATLVLNVDLRDFFDTIHFGRVRGVFAKPPFNFPIPVATVLAAICSAQKRLPQGAPTSPILSNLVCRGLDSELSRLARTHRCIYTRYADDITFSTRRDVFDKAIYEPTATPPLGFAVAAAIAKHGFTVQDKKVRLSVPGRRKEVTGLVVNEKVNVPRRYIRQTRAMINSCERGLASAQARFAATQGLRLYRSPDIAVHIRGRLDFIKMVRGADDPLYCRYAVALEKVVPSHVEGIPITGRATQDIGLLKHTVWVVVGYEASGVDVKHGTAFALQEHGFVTAAHVFEVDPTMPVTRWELISAADPSRRLPITAIREDRHLDLALIDRSGPSLASLRAAASPLVGGERVAIAGFPQWNSTADQMSRIQADVIQTKTVSGVAYVITNAHVRAGNSGGPIISELGEAVGVVLQDASGAAAPNGGIQIAHIRAVQAAPLRQL